MNCKNCNAPLTGKFCSTCGQKADIHPITLSQVMHDFFHAFTHTDRGFLLTIKMLLKRPGFVAKEYIEGKRKKYFNPLSFLVITMAVSAYLSYKSGYFESFNSRRPQKTTVQPAEKQSPKKQTDEKKPLSQFASIKREANQIIINDGKIIGLILVAPLISLLSWIFFRKPKHNLAEHFVLISYFFGLSNVFRVIIFIPMLILIGWDVKIIDAIFHLVFLTYLVIACKQFFSNNLIFTIVKSILILFLFINLFWFSIWGYVYAKHFFMDLFS